MPAHLTHPGTLWSRKILKALIVLNWLVCALIVGLFVFSFIFEPQFIAFYRAKQPPLGATNLIVGLRLMVVIGVLMFPLMHRVLARLLAIVETVLVGDPFVPDNAKRLETIAWAMLGIQALHLVFGVFAKVLSSPNVRIEWTFSLSGWIFVLLLFVLARVFEEGTRMRADLEGTV
ncbi:MAG TPA: DUF2975 domain-containing protein [Xanthomonadales bacterium]|nr:DUF2975 domain-containing protein [Xanthomonadales bacterium]